MMEIDEPKIREDYKNGGKSRAEGRETWVFS